MVRITQRTVCVAHTIRDPSLLRCCVFIINYAINGFKMDFAPNCIILQLIKWPSHR